MLAATRCLLAWRYHEAIGSHSSTADFELTVLPAAAGGILVALLEESKSNEALSPYHKDRLYRGVSFGNPQIIHEIVEDLDEEKLLSYLHGLSLKSLQGWTLPLNLALPCQWNGK